jgi:uncharacterized repeat protein (TIGR01451 family)
LRTLLFLTLMSITSVLCAQADLSIGMTDSPDPMILGTDLTYTIIVRNDGPNPASNVIVTDSLPANMTFQAILAPDDWQCTVPEAGTTGPISCAKSSVASAESSTFTIAVKPAAAGVITNTASIAGREPDPNPVNNFVSVETTVLPGPEP